MIGFFGLGFFGYGFGFFEFGYRISGNMSSHSHHHLGLLSFFCAAVEIGHAAPTNRAARSKNMRWT